MRNNNNASSSSINGIVFDYQSSIIVLTAKVHCDRCEVDGEWRRNKVDTVGIFLSLGPSI